MMQTILSDGRKVTADECITIEDALYGPDGQGPSLEGHRQLREQATVFGPKFSDWHLVCYCCEGRGEHGWSPPSYFNGATGPDSGEYGCDPCAGTGKFKVITEEKH